MLCGLEFNTSNANSALSPFRGKPNAETGVHFHRNTQLAGFVGAFNFLIALAFFLNLCFQNAVLYPPSEYDPAVNAAEFVAAMQ